MLSRTQAIKRARERKFEQTDKASLINTPHTVRAKLNWIETRKNTATSLERRWVLETSIIRREITSCDRTKKKKKKTKQNA